MTSRERIIQAAKELFFRQGIRSVTMDAIASHLGISKKTIYQFFKDKDEIVETLTTEILSTNQLRCDAICASVENPIQEIFELMKLLGEMFSTMNPNLFYDLQKYYPDSWARFREFKQEYGIKTIQENLTKGIEMGLYRSEINVGLLAKLRMEQVEMAMNPAVFPPDTHTIIEVQLALLDHFLHGIVTLKGYEMINGYKQANNESSTS